MQDRTEDQVRQDAKDVLGFASTDEAVSDVGQLTTFNQLGFKGVSDKPDGWYLPKDENSPSLILEVKAEKIPLDKRAVDEINKNCRIARTKYNRVMGILHNGRQTRAFVNGKEVEVPDELQKKEFYLKKFTQIPVDSPFIYTITKRINDSLHIDFGVRNLYHRMIFTAGALVAKRYGAQLFKGMSYSTMQNEIINTLSKSLLPSLQQNLKLKSLTDVFIMIQMNLTDNQEAIDNFISNISLISSSINSDNWNGEDVMAIFFNEFNRYKKKSEHGQVFTPAHIAHFMYRLLECGKDDVFLDAACGSGTFLVSAMKLMIKEAGGEDTEKAMRIKQEQLFGIENDKEIFALACANMMIHKDGKTNLELLDSRFEEAGKWIRSKPITKVLKNPPFETKYGCMLIVKNVLDNVRRGTKCAFILPDKKLEKVGLSKEILKKHSLQKIIKLPENVFNEGVTTSIFVFEAGIAQGGKEIFACYIEDDGLETVKNQGRQDVRNRWSEKEDYWINVIRKQTGDDTVQWIKPGEHLSYQMPEKPFEIHEEDFAKTVMDYLMYEQGIDAKEFNERLMKKVLYSSDVDERGGIVTIKIGIENGKD